MATPNVNDATVKPLIDKETNARQRLLREGLRASLGSIGWAHNDDDAVPYDQVIALIAAGGGGSGDIKSDGSVDFVAAETWDDGGSETVTISPDDIIVTDGSLVIAIATSYSGIQVSSGSLSSTMSSSGYSVTDGSSVSELTVKHVISKAVQLSFVKINDGQSPYSVLETDHTVACNAFAGPIDVQLPSAASYPGMILNIKRIDNSLNALRVVGDSSDVIDDAPTYSLFSQYESIQVQSNGVDGWWII